MSLIRREIDRPTLTRRCYNSTGARWLNSSSGCPCKLLPSARHQNDEPSKGHDRSDRGSRLYLTLEYLTFEGLSS